MPPTKLTNTIIEAAISGFETQKKDLDAQILELRAMLNGTPEYAAEATPATRKRRKFSPATIERMRKAQQERWAKIKGESKTPAPKPKRKLSAATKAKLIANLRKARGAKAKKAAAAKKAARKTSA